MADRIVTLRDNSNNTVYPVGLAPAGSVTTSMYNDASVTTPKLADGSVTTAKLANNSVTSDKLAPGVFPVSDVYPIGSIYLSVNNTNPSTYFGGTWVQIKDTFLLAAGDTYAGGSTGGEEEHVLTIDEMPSHNHTSRTHIGWQSGGGSAVGKVTINDGNYNGWSTDIYNTGGGQAHNNMPPYLAVYVWQRTA